MHNSSGSFCRHLALELVTVEQFLNGYRELSQASNVPVRTLRTLVKNKVIPHIRAGHRTILFSPSKVEKALARRTVKEVS